MVGLYKEIEDALQIIIEGLNYDFSKGISVDDLEPEKMRTIARSKITSLKGAKKIITKWVESSNRPSEAKIEKYLKDVVAAGDSSITSLRKILGAKIDYKKLDPHKHEAAIASKPVILESIFEIDTELSELREKLEKGDLTLVEREFSLGYPERFAQGEFYPKESYYKNIYDEDGSVIIDPKGTKGKRLEMYDLGIILPRPPRDKSKILFSNQPKKEQYWRRTPPPNITTGNIKEYDSYILEEYRRRREGVWFMNNGVSTYLTGNHYWALQWCKMLDDGGYFNYREAQRDLFYFMEACIVDRNSLGIKLLKSRRTGFSYSALSIMLNNATSTKNGKYGMMSKSGVDGGEMFAKISYMFLSLPFWLRPVVRGKSDSPKELFFGQPSDNSKETKKSKKNNVNDYLNTSLDWRNTKNGSYDSLRLSMYCFDECGKIEAPNNAIVHLGMIAPTMMPNGRVVGKMFAGSTMGSHNKGGEQFIELIEGSYVKDRDPTTKKTATGLYFYFIPAQDNMEEFTDIYGKCWKTKPPKGTKNVFGAEIETGSIEYLIAIELQKKKQGDKAYNEQLRTYPRDIASAMRDEGNDCIFNVTKLTDQMDYNRTLPEESKYVIGDLDWKNGIEDTEVIFSHNDRGRFKFAWIPSEATGTKHLQNNVIKRNGIFIPQNGDIVRGGVDPYSLGHAVGEGSKGALHLVTMPHPPGEGVPSNSFVVEYLARPLTEIVFFEDVIKVLFFYGAPALIEANRVDLLRHMHRRGYRKFAMDRVDKMKKDLDPQSERLGGQMIAGQNIIDSHINTIGSWIQNNVGLGSETDERGENIMGNMPFNDTLLDWKKFEPAKRTKYDLTISSGLALMAVREEKYKHKKAEKSKPKVYDFFPTYRYEGNTAVKTKY